MEDAPKDRLWPSRVTLEELGKARASSSERIRGMKADFVIVDDPHAPASPPLDWRMAQYAGVTVATPTDHNSPKADYSEMEKRILAHYAAETERAAQEALIYGSSVRRVKSDGTISPIDMETLSNEQLDEFIHALVGSRPPAEDVKAARDARKREMLKAGYGVGRVLFDPAREPVGGESLWDMTQRKLFEREAAGILNEAKASAEPVYLSQFSDSVFNPTAGAWSGAGRIIDTAD
jgi:hypothetical protein